MTAPAASSRCDDGGVVRRDEGVEDLRGGGRAHAADAQVVLERDRARRRAARARRPPRAADRSPRRASSARSAATWLNALSAGFDCCDAVERGPARLRPPTACPRRSSSRMLAGAASSWSSSDDPRHAEQAGVRRGVRRVGQCVARPAATARGSSSRSRRRRRVDVRGGRDAGGIDRLHLLGVGEDVGELPGEQLLLLVGQLEMRERGDALDIFEPSEWWTHCDANASHGEEQKGRSSFPGRCAPTLPKQKSPNHAPVQGREAVR